MVSGKQNQGVMRAKFEGEATDPLRIVNLPERASGWDDISCREHAFNPAKEGTESRDNGLAEGFPARNPHGNFVPARS
jgi:hypothetical protein